MTNPYPAYKSSGVEWLGNIPEHWNVKKLKYLLTSVKNDFPQTSFRIAVENIESGTGRLVNLSDELFTQSDATGFRPEDVIFNKLRPYLAKVYYANQSGGCLGELLVSRSKGELSGKYTYYRLLSNEFISTVNSSTEGTKMPRASWDDYIAHLKLPYPSFAEQAAIADYLDRRTAQIDDLLAQKRELIALLQEERAGLINDAVTQGLIARAPRKDSGLPWLGKIPAHWEVKKLKYVVQQVLGGGTPSTTEKAFWDGDIPWVSPKDMKVELISSTQDYITELALQNSATTLIPAGSILVVVRSGILKHTLPVAINTLEVTLNQDMKAIVPKAKISNQFLKWLLKGMQKFILTYCSKLGATVDK
ncbi:restriction endonuclease subunit S [Spirosoma arcticum]